MIDSIANVVSVVFSLLFLGIILLGMAWVFGVLAEKILKFFQKKPNCVMDCEKTISREGVTTGSVLVNLNYTPQVDDFLKALENVIKEHGKE